MAFPKTIDNILFWVFFQLLLQRFSKQSSRLSCLLHYTYQGITNSPQYNPRPMALLPHRSTPILDFILLLG